MLAALVKDAGLKENRDRRARIAGAAHVAKAPAARQDVIVTKQFVPRGRSVHHPGAVDDEARVGVCHLRREEEVISAGQRIIHHQQG